MHAKTVVAYGVAPIAGAQLFYYNAVAHLSVGVALLLEYTAPVLVVGWVWARTRRRPTNLTLLGVVLAFAGMMLVLNVFAGAHIDVVGVAWGLAAAVCAACYFVMSANVSNATGDGGGPHPITLAAGGLVVGSAAVTLLGVTGVMPLKFTTDDAVLAAWVLLGEAITRSQAVGGAMVLLGLALARLGDRSEAVAEATWPDGPVQEIPPARANC